MFDFSSVMKIKSAWDTFSRNHPKFMPFMQAVGREAIGDGTIIEHIGNYDELYEKHIKTSPKNTKEKLDYICNKHKEIGIQNVSFASFKLPSEVTFAFAFTTAE